MKISKCLGASTQDVLDKKFNVYIGISLGNKYFSKETIRKYLIWGLENTKESLAILIPDKIHAINYEVRNGYSTERALKLALRKGEELRGVIELILDTAQSSQIEILTWEDIEDSKHMEMVKALTEEFENNEEFKSTIIDVVKENFSQKKHTEDEYNRLAQYVINELPILIRGIRSPKGKNYNLIPYPGLSKIDYLAVDLQEGNTFPELTKKMNFDTECILLEAYAK